MYSRETPDHRKEREKFWTHSPITTKLQANKRTCVSCPENVIELLYLWFNCYFCLSTFVPPVHPNVSQGCQGGCATCSDYNGCLSCKPKLFFVLERIGMKQIGVCLSSCPSGYYGTRYPDINKCTSKCLNKIMFLSHPWGMASLTRWTWVWASSWSWWWTGKLGMLQSTGSQRVRQDWATELNWLGVL